MEIGECVPNSFSKLNFFRRSKPPSGSVSKNKRNNANVTSSKTSAIGRKRKLPVLDEDESEEEEEMEQSGWQAIKTTPRRSKKTKS